MKGKKEQRWLFTCPLSLKGRLNIPVVSSVLFYFLSNLVFLASYLEDNHL